MSAPGDPAPVESDLDDFDDQGEPVSCWACLGTGEKVVCFDDLCHGAGECMHGEDGMAPCEECGGEGEL